jgi:hypothetical protein
MEEAAASAAAAAGPGVRALTALGARRAEDPGAGVGWMMSAGEDAPGVESQPGTERGWGRWWGMATLGGEATRLGWEESSQELGLEQSVWIWGV